MNRDEAIRIILNIQDDDKLPWVMRRTTEQMVKEIEAQHPPLHIPTQKEVDQMGEILSSQISKTIPQIIQYREKKNDRIQDELRQLQIEQKPLIEASNTLPDGEPDKLARLHHKMNFERYELDFDPRLWNTTSKKKRRNGWGKWRNQTRKDLNPIIDRAWIDFVNIQLTTDEIADRRDKSSG